MTDVRKLLARLNPTTVKFDIGSGGGVPELTAQDIAAALAFVPEGIGRDMMCLIWWPHGAGVTRRGLDEKIAQLLHGELSKRVHAVQDAKLALAFLEGRLGSRFVSHATQMEIRKAKLQIETAKMNCWPLECAEVYATLRNAVIDELMEPNLCRACGGRCDVRDGDLVVTCEQCEGSGIAPVSDRARAHRIGRSQTTYLQNWRGPYEWLHRKLSEAEAEARTRLAKALQ
ncbi:hypothetical protein [Aquilutibacter rugosus]|uniref:hypothetical protein n=1 Tax=Aquilutibacter rugosus TaxID=3115820 RepID=UPI002F406812